MRVVLFSHLFPTSQASAMGRFVEDQVQAVAKLDVETTVVTVRFLQLRISDPFVFLRGVWVGLVVGRAHAGVSARGTSYYEIQCPAPRLGGAVQALLYAICAIRFLPRLTEQGRKFDLVHVHTSLLDGTAGRAVANRLRVPLVITEHTGPFRSLLRRLGSRSLVASAFVRASRVLAVSSSLRDDMIGLFPESAAKIQVVPNTFASEAFHFSNSASQEESIGWLGYISEIKRVDRVLATFVEMKKTKSDLKLKIISVDALPEAFMNSASDSDVTTSIERIAAVSRGEVAAALRSLSVLLVTSESETFSVACLEALAVGTPVVSTDCGGPSDIIRSEHDGCIVTSNTPKDLAIAALKIMAADSREARHARAERALAKFGERTIGQAYVDAYRELIATNNS